jgi:hypothetical protein
MYVCVYMYVRMYAEFMPDGACANEFMNACMCLHALVPDGVCVSGFFHVYMYLYVSVYVLVFFS